MRLFYIYCLKINSCNFLYQKEKETRHNYQLSSVAERRQCGIETKQAKYFHKSSLGQERTAPPSLHASLQLELELLRFILRK